MPVGLTIGDTEFFNDEVGEGQQFLQVQRPAGRQRRRRRQRPIHTRWRLSPVAQLSAV